MSPKDHNRDIVRPDHAGMLDYINNVLGKTPKITRDTPWQERHHLFKLYYEAMYERMEHHHRTRPFGGYYRAYPFDWGAILTPIEFEAWCTFRRIGGIVMYPQYPAGPYLIDFAHPFKKIGLELDGKAYHDPERDRRRDLALLRMGWTIYHITGSEMNKMPGVSWYDYGADSGSDWYNEGSDEQSSWERVREWILSTGDGVIEAIKIEHFDGHAPVPKHREGEVKNLVFQTLEQHRLVFPEDIDDE